MYIPILMYNNNNIIIIYSMEITDWVFCLDFSEPLQKRVFLLQQLKRVHLSWKKEKKRNLNQHQQAPQFQLNSAPPSGSKTAPHAHGAPSGGGAVFGLFSRKFPTSAAGDPSAGPATKSQSLSSASPEGKKNCYVPNGVFNIQLWICHLR